MLFNPNHEIKPNYRKQKNFRHVERQRVGGRGWKSGFAELKPFNVANQAAKHLLHKMNDGI